MKSSIQLDAFDKLYLSYFLMDQDGAIRKVFDSISSKTSELGKACKVTGT
jgi:hypothetical protein